MKKTKGIKRIIAVFLSALMLICAMPFNAIAADGVRTIDALDLDALNSGISGYETKINNLSDPSYNMKSNYEKYIYALAVKDMANYGSLNTQSTVDGAEFTQNIAKWNAYTGTYQPKFGSTTVPIGTYKNVLWADGSSQTTFDITSSTPEIKTSTAGVTYACKTWYYWPETTLLYDGSTQPVMPITLTLADYENNYNIHPEYFYLSTSNNSSTNFEMFQNWDGYTTVSGTDSTAYANWQAIRFGWNTTNRSKPIGYNSASSIGKNDNCLDVDQDPSNTSGNKFIKKSGWISNTYYEYSKHDVSTLMKYTYKNYLRYKNTPTGTLTTINPVTFDVKYWMSVVGVKTENDESKLVNVSTPIRIINYKKLIDKVDDKKVLWTGANSSKLATSGNYREGGMSAFFADLDKIEFNPNSFFTSSNNYSGCVSAIDNAYNAIDGPSGKTADSHQTDWNKLRTAEDQNDGTKGKARDVYASGNTKWTTSSWNTFKTAFENVMDKFDGIVTSTSSKTFSYASLSASDATSLSNALNSAYAGLEERADFTDIDNDVASSTYSAVKANYANYTYDSYKAFCEAYAAAKAYTVGDWLPNSATRLDTTKASKQSTLDGLHSNLTAAYNALENPDTAAYYENFDKAYSVVKTETAQTGKYSSNAITNMDTLTDTVYDAVYHEVTAAEADLLGVPAGTVMKKTSKGSTDIYTTDLLEGINEISEADANFNSYTVNFVVTKDGTQVSSTSSTVAFGTAKTFTLGSEYTDDSDTVVWTTVTSDGGSNTVYGGDSLTKKISANITVTAAITSAPTSAGYIYKYYNGNGKLVYSDTHDTKDYKEFDSVKAYAYLPNMTVSDWYTEVNENAKTVTVKAIYTNDNTIVLTANNGSFTNTKSETVDSTVNAQFDKEFTLDYTGSNSFYAWAVKVGNKYTVASYNENYHFYSHCNLDFVPIYTDSGNYYLETENGAVLVTASVIACTSSNYFDFTEDEYVKEMLRIKAPFVAVIAKTVYAQTKCRAYCIVTQGCSVAYTKVGIKFTKNGTDPAANASNSITAVLDSGQYSVTLGNTTLENGAFRATVNFDYNYRNTATLDVMETSDLA